MHLGRSIFFTALALLPSFGSAATIISNATGNWSGTSSWQGAVVPKTGVGDSVEIRNGHAITYNGTGAGMTNAAGAASNDLGADNGNSIVMDGGSLAHSVGGSWLRIGNHTSGTFNIKDGSAYLPIGNVQIGTEANGIGTMLIGDGTGTAGSAWLNLYGVKASPSDPGTASGQATAINLGNSLNSQGTLIIESDGWLDGGANGVIRIGRAESSAQSSLLIKAGGKMTARGVIEVASNVGSKGLLHLNGADASLTHAGGTGELVVGWNGEGSMIVENSAQYTRQSSATRKDIFVGRYGPATGTLTIRNNGQFIREGGANAGNFILGDAGNGTLIIESGGKFINNSGNFDFIGSVAGGRGAVYVNAGGSYLSTSSATVQVGFNAASATLPAANGLFVVNGGEFSLNTGSLLLGELGNGTFRQISGTTSVSKLAMAGKGGVGTLDLQGGTLTVKNNFFMGGDTGGAADMGAGTATATQSGGTFYATNAMTIGLSVGHTATYTMTGGEFHHTTGTTTIGEKGTGTFTVGENAKFYDNSSAVFFIGRENNSNGTLIVDGLLEKSNSSTGIRVGHGNTAAENNSTGRGYIGGGGTITTASGITIGNYGTIGAGTKTTVDHLTINGNLNLISTVGSAAKSTLFVNFDSSNVLGSDRLTVNGDINLTNAAIDGKWTTGSTTGLASRYWVIINEGPDVFLGDFFFDNMYLESSNLLAASYLSMGADGFVMIDGMEFAMFYQADFANKEHFGGRDLMLSAMGGAVPEPSKIILCLGGLLALVMRRRRH